MANENQYYKFTFAELGNFTVIPDQASSGNVDYESGFGPDYEKVDGESDRKLIERETFNGLMQGVTKNIKQWQESNYPTWIEDNGDGTPFTYIEGSIVDHDGFYWVATEDADIEPSDTATTWRKFKPNSTVEVAGEGGNLTQTFPEVQEILNDQGSTARTTFIMLASNISTGGVVSLSQPWNNFEEIIVDYAGDISGNPREHMVFFTGLIAPSDSAIIYNYAMSAASSSTTGFNFMTDTTKLRIEGNLGDDDKIIAIYGRFPK